MEKDNKKALYESIMAAVAKEVKKVLNESSMSNLSRLQRKFVQAVLADLYFVRRQVCSYFVLLVCNYMISFK